MPKRSNFGDLENMKVEQKHCVTLGGKYTPVPIPTITENGVECVPLNASSVWLTSIVGVGCRGDAQLVVKEFVTSVLQTLPEPGEGGVGGDAREAEEGSSAAAGSEASDSKKMPPKGRAAMGLDDDSDEEEVAATNVEARASTMPAAKKEEGVRSCSPGDAHHFHRRHGVARQTAREVSWYCSPPRGLLLA